MTRVYAWMTAGLAVTGAVAALTARSPAVLDLIYGNVAVFWGLFVLQLIVVFALSAAIDRLSGGAATALFLGYSALNGLTLSGIFLYYTGASIAATFLITAGMFGAMSIYGATTKRDLTAVGSIAFMALIGLILASVVSVFLRSAAIDWIISYAGVADLRRPHGVRHPAIRATMAQADATWRGQARHPGGADALPRLPQPVPVPAAPLRAGAGRVENHRRYHQTAAPRRVRARRQRPRLVTTPCRRPCRPRAARRRRERPVVHGSLD